jgi:hypothetical protein
MPITQEHEKDWRAKATVTVEEAAGILGLGRASAYTAATNGDLPTIQIGRRLLVPVARLRQMLGEEIDPTNEQRLDGDRGATGKKSDRDGGPAPARAA